MHVLCFPFTITLSLSLSAVLCVFYFASVVVFNSVFPFMSWRLYLKKIQFIWPLQRGVVDAAATTTAAAMPHFTLGCSTSHFDCFLPLLIV